MRPGRTVKWLRERERERGREGERERGRERGGEGREREKERERRSMRMCIRGQPSQTPKAVPADGAGGRRQGA
jgi:hypothetical protein